MPPPAGGSTKTRTLLAEDDVTMTVPIFPQQVRSAADFTPDRSHTEKRVHVELSDEEAEEVDLDPAQSETPGEATEEGGPDTEPKS
jgi:hypothetical protein